MASRRDHWSLPTAVSSVDGHVPGDDHDPGATPTASPAAVLGNQAAARMLSTEGARPEAVMGLTGVSNRAVARMLDPAAGGGAITPEVADRIAAQRGGGTPLPDTLRSPMEQHLGTDLGDTRVHTDDAADTLARSLGAEAFTTGNDIFFSAGSYAPQSAAGRELIAHEAVHVAQQSGRIGFSGRVTDPSDAAEVEARALAPAVARSAEVSPTAVPATGVAGQDVQLAPATESATVDMDVQRFLNLTTEANTKVDNNYKALSSWMLGLCIAYGTAYKRHTDALEDQAETDQIVQGLILGAALAFVSGGAGGAVAAAMERKQVGKVLMDGAEELTQFGVELADGAGTSAVGFGLDAFPTDPLTWQGLAERSVDRESLKVGLQLEAWQHRANANDPTFRLNFDPVAAVDSALRIAGLAPVDLPDVGQAELADNFERGMWKEWLEQYGYRIVTMRHTYVTTPFGSIGSDEDMVLDNARKNVVDRCEALGLDIAPYLEVARKNAQAEADARNRKRDGE